MAIYQGTIKVASSNVTGDTLPIGSMIPYGSLTIPEGWLRCDGSAVSRTTYSQLFSVIGTSYGVGDGSTTFNLPNKKGRVSVGYDSAQTEFDTIGKTGGAKTVTLSAAQIPTISSSISHIGMGGGSGYGINVSPQLDSSTLGWLDGYITSSNTGGQAHNNLQPYETDVWIIKARQSSGVVATVVDNLTSTSSVNALSAKQGKVLDDKIETLDTSLSGGWIPLTGTFTYSSADAPTFVMSTSVDLTGTVGLGMKIKLTQATVKYFIVTAITSNSITMYGGTDYTLTSDAISNVYYSIQKTPYGFPMSADKWSVIKTYTGDALQSSPGAGVWYNLGSVYQDIPIGFWDLGYKVTAQNGVSGSSSQNRVITTTLSTTNNGTTNSEYNMQMAVVGNYIRNTFEKSEKKTFAVKTRVYLNTMSDTATGDIMYNLGGGKPTQIIAVCAYL